MPNWLKGGIFMLSVTTIAFLVMLTPLLLLKVISTYITPWLAMIILPAIGVFAIGAMIGAMANGIPSKRFDNLMDRIWNRQ